MIKKTAIGIAIIISLIFLFVIFNYVSVEKTDIRLFYIIPMIIFVYSVCVFGIYIVWKKLYKNNDVHGIKNAEQDIKKNENVKYMESIIINYYRQKKELENAINEAESQTKAKEVFLQNMSHEIRTPLNGIVNMTELLKHTNLDEKQKRYTGNIIRVSNTLISIINNILDYSKLQAKKAEVRNEPFSLYELVEELKSFFISSVKRDIFVLFSISKIVPEMLIGDGFKLKQILINIIGNSIKFTKDGYILLEIGVVKNEENKAVVSFVITDTGIGIPEEKRKELFTSFMQADESISRRYGGTGLGLSISKEIVEIMGGKITVNSEIKIGTSFNVEIPFEHMGNGETEDFNEENVIIFQDRRDITELLLKYLSEYKLGTHICGNYEELEDLLAELENQKWVIITTSEYIEDNQIVFQKIQKNEKIQKNMILICESEYSGESQISKCTFLEKPIEINEMLRNIRQIIKYGHVKNKGDEENYKLPILRKKIILIEDNEINGKAIKEILELMGSEVLLYDYGLEAYKNIRIRECDIIISDIQLPDLSGFELIKLIRDNDEEKKQYTKTIALTAHVLGEYREKCLNAGFDEYLAKPVTMLQLYKTILKLTENNICLEENNEKEIEIKNNEIFEKLKEELIAGALKSFEKTEAAIADKNYDAIAFETHKVKGSFGNAKNFELYNEFVKLEEIVKSSEFEKVKKQFDKCKKMFEERYGK